MRWSEFKKEAPEIAAAAEKLFDKSGVILLGSY